MLSGEAAPGFLASFRQRTSTATEAVIRGRPLMNARIGPPAPERLQRPPASFLFYMGVTEAVRAYVTVAGIEVADTVTHN